MLHSAMSLTITQTSIHLLRAVLALSTTAIQ
jgi:hypothetical protein